MSEATTAGAATSAAPARYQLDALALYPRDMNIYGDRGNLLALVRRGEAHGIEVRVHELNPGDSLPGTVDVVIGGGGQDSGQLRVAADLPRIAPRLRELAAAGTPMLLICGLYQLFGHEFVTHTGERLTGIGILDCRTVGGKQRMIGNIVLESSEFGEIIGYENHSGGTELGPGSEPFGRVLQGDGNSPGAGVEGARTGNVIGTYLHGSLLPKNPAVTDFLLREAFARRYPGEPFPAAAEGGTISGHTVEMARRSAKQRPR